MLVHTCVLKKFSVLILNMVNTDTRDPYATNTQQLFGILSDF